MPDAENSDSERTGLLRKRRTELAEEALEIEFKDADGKPTAKKLYLQLKSGDSHLRKRQSDGTEIFQIHHQNHAVYWMSQAYPVFLVIGDSNGTAVGWKSAIT
jgi:hypothetical protein